MPWVLSVVSCVHATQYVTMFVGRSVITSLLSIVNEFSVSFELF